MVRNQYRKSEGSSANESKDWSRYDTSSNMNNNMNMNNSNGNVSTNVNINVNINNSTNAVTGNISVDGISVNALEAGSYGLTQHHAHASQPDMTHVQHVGAARLRVSDRVRVRDSANNVNNAPGQMHARDNTDPPPNDHANDHAHASTAAHPVAPAADIDIDDDDGAAPPADITIAAPANAAPINNNNSNNNNSNNNSNNNQNPDSNGGNSSATDASLDIDNEPALEGYERTDRIGQGAYGIVYRGVQRSTGVTVAIKRIPFADAAPEGGVPCNVIREISLLRELDHPNVVRLLDVNQARPGELYLVFEFVAYDLKTFLDKSQLQSHSTGTGTGGTNTNSTTNANANANANSTAAHANANINANAATTRRHGLPPDLVRSFMKQILEGVGYCHTYRILHRDLKPHNLLISADGTQVKLADFGLARLSGLPSGPYTSEVVTLWYRAPELLMGATRYCGPVDVWSIGCIFAEMATGYALFPGRSDIDQLFKIFQKRGTPVHEPALNRLPHYNPEFPKWQPKSITDFVDLDGFGSSHAADLLEQLLQYDPEKRLICKQALHHPFFLRN